MDNVRGKAYNLSRYKQVIDYSGLQFEGGITPTDIDGAIDFGGKFFVFIELKFGHAPMPNGQRRFLEALCERIGEGAQAVAFVARHNAPSEQEIDAARCIVSDYYWGGWKTPKTSTELRRAIEIIKAAAESASKVVQFNFKPCAPDISPRTQSLFSF